MAASTPGRWPVVLSGRAIRELRRLSEDKRTLEIVRTKLKEISCGQFTSDNHLPVRGSTEYIPIFRARLSNDLRIIYLIDLVSDVQNKYDRQAIKVFSVSSRARVAYDFWVKVSKFLAQQGTEYRDRCIQRDVLNTPNGPINVPASFEHQEYVLVVADPDSVMDAEASMNELHETVVLEKFTPVTKSLYNSILADMEAVLPMALNPDEKAIVRHHGTSVVIGRSGTGKTTALIYKMRANSQLGAQFESSRPTRQLFVTRSKVLTQHIAANYRGLIDSSEIANKSDEELEEIRKANQKYQNRELVEFDNEIDLREDLPRRFSQLTEANFPLFVSFEKLCDLLEADTLSEEDSLTTTKVRTRRLITFSDFKHRYWPTFDSKLIRHMDPALVYSEILGVIKGYGRNLSMDEYLSDLSHKKSPLLADVRQQVYAIFEAYTKQSRLYGEIDAADRTRALLENYKVTSDSQVDYIFVDEVQDHLMADVYLLQSLCSNLDGGYWCGDTAQTINIGSSFRIKDLKAYIYENMLPKDDTIQRQRKAAAPFATFELTVNFRSHGGIVRYAASLVELIYTLFPNSIDHMKPESAKTPGKAPLLFISQVDDEEMFVRYLLDRKPIEQAAPFGAQQAIIVRSESTAKSLTTRLQKRCTVLSLLETKGLEFDDLIVYNFFAESEAPPSAWRVVLGLSAYNENGRVQYGKPDLSAPISPVLCSELKQLYVAVTRARHRCWLWDSGATIDLMKVFWEKLQLVAVSESLESLGKFAASSQDLRQWAYRGQEFFSTGLYELAVSCFERAGQDKEAAIASAYHHMSEAKMLQANNPGAKSALVKAAEMMKACAESSDREGSSHSSTTLWYHSATCFADAHEVIKASKSYCRGGFYNEAALLTFEAQEMDECLNVVASYGSRLEATLFNKIKDVYSVYYLRERKYSQLRRFFGGSLVQCIECARSLKFGPQLKELLKMNQQFNELADIHLEDGLPVEAIRCLFHNLGDAHAIERSRNIASTYLWSNCGFNTKPNPKTAEQAKELIDVCASLLGGLKDPSTRHDLDMFRVLLSRAYIPLEEFEELLSSLDHADEEDHARIILIKCHVLEPNDWISSPSHSTFSSHLRAWCEHTTSIKGLEELHNPSQHKTVRRLFGLSDSAVSTAISASSIHIPDGSTLQASSPANRGLSRSGKKTATRGTHVTTSVANQRIRSAVAEYLKKRLIDVHLGLFGSPWTRISSPWKNNSKAGLTVLDSEATAPQSPSFEELIRSLSSIFLILNTVKGSIVGEATKGGTEKIQILWITRLFNTVFPPTGEIKNTAHILSKLDPPGAIRTWVSETLDSLDPVKHDRYFATLLVMCMALASELYPNRAPIKTVSPLQLKKGARPPPGCLTQPDLFTRYLSVLFQRNYPGEFFRTLDAIEHIVYHELSMDIAVVVHLVEQIVREVIWSVRAVATCISTLDLGFSGLIAPISWATSLASHPKLDRTLEPSSINRLMRCVRDIFARLLNGVPAHRKPINKEPRDHTIGSLAARLIWSTCFIVVNLRPGHPSMPAAFGAIKLASSGMAYSHNSLADDLGRMNIDLRIFSKIVCQRSCLEVLSQAFQHEDIVMLSDDNGLICPAKQHFVPKIITFRDLADLRRALLAAPSEKLTTPTVEPTIARLAPESVPQQTSSDYPLLAAEPPVDIPLVTPDVLSPSAEQLPALDAELTQKENLAEVVEEQVVEVKVVQPTLTREEAVPRIQAAWRRRMKRIQLQPSDFDEEGQLYEEYSQIFPKPSKKGAVKARDRVSLKLVRGPCLSVVLALRMLVEEMDDYLERLDDELKAPDLKFEDIAKVQKSIQQRKSKICGHKDKADECLQPKSVPRLLKASNFAGVKTQTGKAWDVFMLVKNSGMLPRDETFQFIEELMARGRDIVLEAAKRF